MAAHDGPYQVYISFAGDTRNNFTGFLQSALKREGFDVFEDKNLLVGEPILPSLFRIIRSSKLSILVISKGYVDSKWCLVEMIEIVERYQSKCQIVQPVFFDVDPRDVLHQTGIVAESLQKHKREFDEKTLKKWKNALTVVAGIRGYELSVNQDQAKVVDLVVQEALIESGRFRSLDSRGKVFISYRGKDTGKTFIGFLHSALEREGIDVYKDENLSIGEMIQPIISRIIQSTKISIPVISKGYADSQWCLVELAEMVECYEPKRQIILPVFFDVDPNETGIFDASFEKHKEHKIDEQTLKRWKNALTVVAHLPGYKLKDVEGDQAELVDLIVEKVLIESSSFRSNDGCAKVFTNYQREDTGNNFSGVLRSALGKRRIDAFINSENLGRGKLFPNHFGIIRSTIISISIISKRYADNKWCLIELAEMVERYEANCQIIVPVFLDVDPEDVKHQTGIFKASFEKHKNDEIDERTLKIWKHALTVVAGISGFQLKDVNGNQAKLVDLIVGSALIKSSSFVGKHGSKQQIPSPECNAGW
ncbi:hypothetical protein NE237_031227 [Protea cynaroides]|uniref:ADP-ribosyl cyclase/cyclic ADP-ribose hydrolase n=1 Tax=Protea cynaroides TaxID=273540 RepID=A0A9Q0L174_9MAGN|nr:hypothetical protein NE237_031227 [Protea cynaroides]